jgi:hypothetical protein
MSGIVDDLLGDFAGAFSIAVSNPPNMSIELSFRSCDTLFNDPGVAFALLALPPKASKKDMSFVDNQESIVSDLDTVGDVNSDEVVCACSMTGDELSMCVCCVLLGCFSDIADITLDSDGEVASTSADILRGDSAINLGDDSSGVEAVVGPGEDTRDCDCGLNLVGVRGRAAAAIDLKL